MKVTKAQKNCPHGDWGWRGKTCKKCGIDYRDMPEQYQKDRLMIGSLGPYT